MSDSKNQEGSTQNVLQPGDQAPDFTLNITSDQTVSLHDFRGQPVVLLFYPADWSPVCTSEIALYNQLIPEFHKYNAEVLGISVDGPWSHQAFKQERNIHFPLLSDFEPKGAVARKYGVYDAEKGREKRALFVIDSEGIIQWSYVSPSGVNPGADGVLSALDDIKEKEKYHE